MRALIKKIRQLLKDKRFRKIWYRGVSSTAAVVVFITTYALVLPAITMESEASCGIPAHQHSTDCYEEQLICGLEESDGHHHTDDCYTVTKELKCTIPEHQHDETCFDEDGNLTCSQAEHTHDSTCYEEHRELTCGLEESEGHHHDSSCYKQVLTCGLEAHIHSVECYKEDSKAVTASTSIQASDDFDGAVAATAAFTSVTAETYEPENASNGSNSSAACTASKMTTDDADSTDAFEAANASTAFDENSSTAELSSAAATTGVLPEPVEQEDLSEGYVPTLDPVNMDQVLDKHTGFYYYHAGEGEELPASSTEITSWKKVDDNTELAPTDLVKAYFAYTIPAGTLNETNQVARYRLPSNLHLTDDQIIAINQQENGIAASYIDYDTLQILDTDNYHKYLGAEAIEGTRTPDQTLTEGTQEYISAVVKAENVYDDEGIYGEKGAYLGQDLIFIFTPYTIEKNQNTYGTGGDPTSAGQKVSGWFACDFNMGQIDWVEAETDTDHDKTTVKKTADILFAAQDDSLNIKEISQTLKLVETIEAPENTAEDAVGETADADDESAEAESTNPEETEDNAATSATEDTAEMTDDSAADISDTAETTEAVSTSEEEPAYKDGTLTASGADYTITLDYTADACIPENAELKIREITKESDPEAYDACLSQAKEQVVGRSAEDNTAIDQKASRFFDIEIVAKNTASGENGTDSESAEEQKIEPKVPVNVNIQLSNIGAGLNNTFSDSKMDSANDEGRQTEPTVLHFAEQGVEKIEATANDGFMDVGTDSHTGDAKVETSTDIRFEAASFSVYGVVYTSISTTYISASGETYEITVSYDKDAGIPEGSRLAVSEIEPGTEEYTSYLQDSAEKLGLVSSDLRFARFFDIEIQKEDISKGIVEKIEPKTPVSVQITYRDAMSIGDDDTLNVIHFADKDDAVVPEVISGVEVSEDNAQISYIQNSFSVTGTVISGAPSADAGGESKHMVFVKYEGNYYIVNNDAALTKITPDQADNPHYVYVDDPMLWSFEQSGGNKHIYFNSEATGFGPNLIASDYYRRYLDPRTNQAWLQEQNKDSTLESYVALRGKYVAPDGYGTQGTDQNGYFTSEGQTIWCNEIVNHNAPMAATNLTINTNNSTNTSTVSHDGMYLAVECDEAGTPIRLVGGETDSGKAAQFMFANADQLPQGLHSDHAVNHIDISISGAAQVKIPLAYGKYYDAEGNEILNVIDNTKVTLTEDQVFWPEGSTVNPLEITPEDMKRATIIARDKDGNELDDAFYITGFSQNAVTAYSTSQVRIDGKFLVSDLRNHTDAEIRRLNDSRYYGGFNGYQFWWPDQAYVNRVNQARKDNVIDYTVTVIKPVTYYLVKPDDPTQYLYDADGELMKVTVDVAFSGSFNYWDYGKTAKNSGNECPPIQNNQAWRDGDIPNHDMSGMDFKLIGDAENPNSPLVAIEITKVIMDEQGNRIDVKIPSTSVFDIYESKTADRNAVQYINVNQYQQEWDNLLKDNGGNDLYSKLRTRSITISSGDNGSSQIYDYNVTNGMYYIVEHSDGDLEKTVTDTNDQEWKYSKTYIETEYVRRRDEHDEHDDPMHVTKEYTVNTDGTQGFKSMPEVVGTFTLPDGVTKKKSGFLEFYVYNIYTRAKELPVEKEWTDGAEAPANAEVKVDLYYATKPKTDIATSWPPVNKNTTTYTKVEPGKENSPFENYRTQEQADAGEGEDKPILNSTLTLNSAGNWKGKFENLPETVTVDGVECDVDYYAVEAAVLVPAEGHAAVDNDAVNVTSNYWLESQIKDGKVLLKNKNNETQLSVEKKWKEGTDAPAGGEVTVELRYAKKKLLKADGTEAEGEEADFPRTQDEKIDYAQYQPIDEFFRNAVSSDHESTDLTTVKTLQADSQNSENNWKAAFTGLPRYVKDNTGATWELDYYAVETSVTIPGTGNTRKDVTSQYIHKDVKEDAEGDDALTSDGKVTITNRDAVVVKVKKEWVDQNGNPVTPPDGAYAEVQLMRLKKDVTNPQDPFTQATVVKKWDDEGHEQERPDSVTVQLYKNGTAYGEPVSLTAPDWTYTTLKNLKKMEGENAVSYTWQEVSVPAGYTMTSSQSTNSSGPVTTITNTYAQTEPPEKKMLRVVKVWDDNTNRDGKRPASIEVKLNANGTEVDSVTLGNTNQWNASLEMPVNDEHGDPITYTWEEVLAEQVLTDYPTADATISAPVYNPATNIETTTITNKHVPERTQASIIVNWVGDGDALDKRPASLDVTLSDDTSYTLQVENNWRATADNLYKYLRGREIDYSWNVPGVPGYTMEVVQGDSTNGHTTTVTYTLKPVKDTVTISISPQLFEESLDEDFWKNCAWSTDIQEIFVNGVRRTDISPTVADNNNRRTVTIEVPKNSTVRFKVQVSGSNMKLNSFLSPVAMQTLGQVADNGGRTVIFKVGEDDVDIFSILSKSSVTQTIEPGIQPEPNDKATIYVAVDDADNDYRFINNTELFKEIVQGVPVNSTLSLQYSWDTSKVNESQIGYSVYWLDKTSNLDYGWVHISDKGNFNNNQIDNITIGDKEEYLILIRRNKHDKDAFTVHVEPVSSGANAVIAPGLKKSYISSAEPPVIAVRSLSGLTDSEPMMSGGTMRAVTGSTYPAHEGIDFDSSTNGGYVEDEAFNNGTDPYTKKITLTLKNETGYGWEQSFPPQDKYDENGNEYIYYVVETAFSGDDFYTASITGDLNNGEEVIVTNKKNAPQNGTLNITKAVTAGADATGKEFTFEVLLKNSDDTAFTDSVMVTDSTRATAASATPDANGKITVTVSGTGTATIAGIPAESKYLVTEPAASIPNGWKQEGAITSADTDGTISAGEIASVTITNTPTQFEFSKVWKNKDGQTYDTWQKDITVTLYRKSSGTQEEAVKVISISGNGTNISPDDATHTAALTITPEAPASGKENLGYKYTITGEGLIAYDNRGNEYTYYVKEGDVNFYNSTYGVFDGDGDTRTPRAVDGNTTATDGGVIINTPVDAVELPSTGGLGTRWIYIFGAALTFFAAGLIWKRKPQ